MRNMPEVGDGMMYLFVNCASHEVPRGLHADISSPK